MMTRGLGLRVPSTSQSNSASSHPLST
jgi:hypothetical protein